METERKNASGLVAMMQDGGLNRRKALLCRHRYRVFSGSFCCALHFQWEVGGDSVATPPPALRNARGVRVVREITLAALQLMTKQLLW